MLRVVLVRVEARHGASVRVQIIPAIDLRGGKCVRLQQGDFARETVFSADPVEMARQWVEQGAERLHLVDLDGARRGILLNQEVIQAIAKAVEVPCQLGGGIRDEEQLRLGYYLGADRLIIGTAAITDPAWLRAMTLKYAGKLLLGLDARDGVVATEGWLESSAMPALDVIAQFDGLPLAGVIYTDIARDGMMGGPNREALAELCRSTRLPVIASGGISSIEDLRALRQLPLAGAIVGRALYEGRFQLAEAIRDA